MQGSLQSFGVEQIAPKMTVSEYFVHLEEAIRELGRSHLCESCAGRLSLPNLTRPRGEAWHDSVLSHCPPSAVYQTHIWINLSD